jgi:aminoglycoside phosphotransferase (APT) family kinase protein
VGDYREQSEKAVESATGETVEKIVDVSGAAHKTFAVSTTDRQLIVKFCHQEKNEHRFRSAPAALRTVDAVPTPDLIHFDGTRSVVPEPFMVISYEEGQVLNLGGSPDFRYVSEARKRSLSIDIGRRLGMLHRENKMAEFGRLEYENGEAKLDSRRSWPDLYLEILREEQLAQMSEPFQDLVPMMENWLEDNISFLETGCAPCLVHQDLKIDNMIAGGRKVRSVIDWERAISGHPELDLFTTDSRLFSRFTSRTARKYRPYLYRGYFDERGLQQGWKTRREFYKLLKTVEAMWTFKGWSEDIEDTEAVERHLRQTMRGQIDHIESLM